MNSVSISIVSYCQKNLLKRCLTQIEAIGLPGKWPVIVVDNNSSDGSADMVQKHFPWVKLHRLRKNVGFAGGHNIAFSRTSSSIFVVLNPDVIVLPGSIEELVSVFDEFPKVAIAGPRLLNPDGSLQYSARRFYDWRTVLCRRLPVPGRSHVVDFHLMKDIDYNRPRSVDWVLGAAMALRRSAFCGNTLFDGRYKLYFEDVDLCYFARKKGWDVLYYPTSTMLHDHQRASARKIFDPAVVHHFASWIKFYIKTKSICRKLTQER